MYNNTGIRKLIIDVLLQMVTHLVGLLQIYLVGQDKMQVDKALAARFPSPHLVKTCKGPGVLSYD